jgi:hypothetical protein
MIPEKTALKKSFFESKAMLIFAIFMQMKRNTTANIHLPKTIVVDGRWRNFAKSPVMPNIITAKCILSII